LSKNLDGPGHESRCPDCGLVLHSVIRGAGPELTYDFLAWNQLCKFPLLGGPSMCLARAFEPMAAPIEPGLDHLDDPIGRPFGYS
jgi:hypothetical protein